MLIEDGKKLDFSDVLIRPKRSEVGSRGDVSLTRRYAFLHGGEFEGIPICASNMDGVGTIAMAAALSGMSLFTCLAKTVPADDVIAFFNAADESEDGWRRLAYVGASIGINSADLEAFEHIYRQTGGRAKYLVVDVANAHHSRYTDVVKMLRDKYPGVVIVGGNVCVPEMAHELVLSGVDIVKVGIGNGSACTTRLLTGCGYPQLSAVIECADACHGLNAHVMSDGGMNCAGDVAKAFAAGADFTLSGSIFAGHVEGGGEVIEKRFLTNELDEDGRQVAQTKRFVKYYGMSSSEANNKHFGGLKDYRSSEGRIALIDHKPDLRATVQNMLGGLRSACTYVGARNLKQLSKCATFVRVGSQYNKMHEGGTIGY